MAAGYENRQGGRQTFAFEPARVSQTQPNSQSGFRGIQMDGGSTSVAGGVAAAAQFTTPGAEADRIGGFLNDLLAPAIERRKKEQFVAGMVDQMSAVAGEEIRVNNKNPLNQIFGPAAYEEGAIFYAAKDAVNQWQSRTLADMDNLKRLPPEELTKVVAASFDTMRTGDKFTDLAVETSLIEASGPIIGAISKERYKWQQSEALNNWSNAATSGAGAFQQTMTSLATNSDPSDAGNLAANSAYNNFRSSLAMPVGMDEETYRKGLIGFYRKAAQEGNGYAVSALKSSGFLDLLTDEEYVRLEDAEVKYGNRALGAAAMEFQEDIDRLAMEMQFGKISATDAMAGFAELNEKIKARTGFDLDLYDYKDITGAGKTVWSAMHAQLLREQARREQLEDRARAEQFVLDRDAAEADTEFAQIKAAWATGQVGIAIASDVGSTANYNVLAQADFAEGNWSNLVKAFNNDQWVSPLVKNQAQAQIGSSIGQEYNKDFENGYQKFLTVNKIKPAAAMAYYGKFYAPLMNYQRLVTTGKVSPTQAFLRAFSNPGQYVATPKLSTEASTAITSWVDSNRADTWGDWGGIGLGRKNLTKSGRAALQKAMAGQLGVMMQNSDTPPEALIPDLYQSIVSSGAYEDYGRLGWSNPVGTPNLGKTLGLQQDEADEVVQMVIDKRLKAVGFEDGVRGDNFDIKRIKGSDGQSRIAVVPYDDETGAGTAVTIPISEFKAYADELRAGRVVQGRRKAKPTGLDPYRRIKGETVMQRTARISREKDQNFRAKAGVRER